MTFVVDASVALAWCFDDELVPVADQVLASLDGEGAVAPSIWPLEVANGLRSAERRGRIDERELPRLVHLMTSLPIEVESVTLDRALARVLPMARMLGLSAYDAAYLDLAIIRELPLATADEYLAQAATAAGVELYSPS